MLAELNDVGPVAVFRHLRACHPAVWARLVVFLLRHEPAAAEPEKAKKKTPVVRFIYQNADGTPREPPE